MAKFRKKPVVVEAEQFFPTVKPWPPGVSRYVREYTEDEFGTRNTWYAWRVLQISSGPLEVLPGDWIIQWPDGGIAVFNDDFFRTVYEPVEEQPK